MQWTALLPGHLLDSVFDLQTASNWDGVPAALSKWDVPGQNFVYADTKGNIGYQMTGQMPIRKKGDGSVPEPGGQGRTIGTGSCRSMTCRGRTIRRTITWRRRITRTMAAVQV